MKVVQLTTDAREHRKDYRNPRPYFGTAPEALLEGFQTMTEEVEIHVVSCLQKAPVSSPDKLADNIYYHALKVPNIGWMKTGYLGCTKAVRRKLREIQPDLVHGQGTERDCSITAVRSGYPNILTIHGNMQMIAEFVRAKPFSYYWLAARLERYCLRNTHGVIAISKYTEANVSTLTRRAWLLPNAVHPSYFRVIRNEVQPRSIICAANIDARKNQIQLIHALEPLANHGKLTLRFAGAGNAKNSYFQRFTAEVASRPWCSYAGALNRTSLQAEMSRAQIAALPSLEDNCPMVVLEAAAAGVPMAASRVGGIPDLIQHKETGMLFDPCRVEDIRAAITSLLVEPNLAETLATRARREAVAKFSPLTVARKHLEVYREIVGSARGTTLNNSSP
jgi:glycosyltransferase involved in cell wall biosynthesis